jgi:hypothetical protein
MDRSSHCPKYRPRCSRKFSVPPACRSTYQSIGIMGCPSCGGQCTHSASRMLPTELHSSIKSIAGGADHIAGCPSFGGQRTRSLCQGGFAAVVTQSQHPQRTGPTARGVPSLLRASTASRSSGSQCEPCESRSPLSIRSLQPVAHELKQMSTALNSAPNRSVEATSNGWPHRASCSFLALCGQPSAAPHLLR